MKLKPFLLIFLSLINYLVYTQNNTAFLNNYKRLGLHFQVNQILDGSSSIANQDVNFNVIGYKTFEFGITANVFQFKNLNFKTGLNYKKTYNFFAYNFQKEITGQDFDLVYKVKSFTEKNKIISIPFIAEYYFNSSKKIKPFISIGLKANYHPKNDINNYSYAFGTYENPLYIETDASSVKGEFFGSSQFGFGLSLHSKPFLIQAKFEYNKNFSNILQGNYYAYNYPSEPSNSVGTFNQNGDYIGFGLNFYLHKRIKISYDEK